MNLTEYQQVLIKQAFDAIIAKEYHAIMDREQEKQMQEQAIQLQDDDWWQHQDQHIQE